MKKAILITALLLLIASVVTLNRHSTYPTQTGGDRVQVVPAEYYAEISAIEQLNNLLPLTIGEGTTITFDYSIGKYLVQSSSSEQAQLHFAQWHQIDPYNNIPENKFKIK